MKGETGKVKWKRATWENVESGVTLRQHYKRREFREKVTTWSWNAERERDCLVSSRSHSKRGIPSTTLHSTVTYHGLSAGEWSEAWNNLGRRQEDPS